MKYIIVGSGPTGLSLAYVLSLNNVDVELIESDDKLGGSWNSEWIDNKYFSENSPRVYSDTGNSNKLMSHIGMTTDDFQNIYGNFFETNYKLFSFITEYFHFLDYFIFLYSTIKYKFVDENITVQEWMTKSQLSHSARKGITILSILICDRPDKTNINDFFGTVSATLLGSVSATLPKQMKEPNKWHELIEKHLMSKNVTIMKNTKVDGIREDSLGFIITTKDTKYGYQGRKVCDKVFLCTQSNGIYPILKNSSHTIQNNWMPIEKMKTWSENTFYSGFGFQLHFDKAVKHKKEWCWSCKGDWTVIILPVSNWLKKYSNDPDIKTVWSCCIVDMDTKSKRINKTANECTRDEVIDECFFQMNEKYKIPSPKIITTSSGLQKLNNQWVSKNTGYTKGTYDDLPMRGKIKNMYALGCFTKSPKNHIAYMVGAIDATAHYLEKYEDLPNNIFT
jgi:hypothetical protein